MTIHTKKTLPVEAQDYFSFYKTRSRTELVRDQDLERILTELRHAYSKYKEHQTRIEAIAAVLKSGKNARLPKRLDKPFTFHRVNETTVKQALT